MAVTRTSTGALVSSAAALTATFGVGATAGDLGILIVETANQTITTPTGWSQIDNFGVGVAAAAGATRCAVYAKASITAGDISGGISVSDSGDHQNAVLLTFTGYDATTPYVDTFFASDSSTVTTTPNINGATGRTTTVTANDLALAIICTDRDSATVSTNSGATWSNIAGSNSFIVNVSSATAAGGGIIVNQLTPSGTQTVDVPFNCTITASAWAGVVLVIKAPSGSIALTGQSLTSTIGSLLAATALALTGQALTVGQGSVGVQRAPPFSGQSLAAAQGSATGSVTVALTGQSLAVGQGSVGIGAALSGQSLSVAQGSVAEVTSVALTGQSLSVARGTVAPATAEALSGQAASISQGTLTPGTAEALSGQSLSVAQGSLTGAPSIALSGQGTTLAQGSINPVISAVISGQSLAMSQGAVVVGGSSNVTAALTGQSVSAARGSVTGSVILALSGQSTALSQGTTTAAFGLTFAGQTLAVSQGTLITALGGGNIKVDLGTGFITKPIKVWDGSAWVTKPLKFWTGTVWRATGY